MKASVVAIVQARMGSSRFPGKMLAKLGSYPLLEWVLRRVSQSQQLDHVVLATSDRPSDDLLVSVAEQCGIKAFRGSESDVLQRFVGAARQTRADWVVRVCGDNPFIDPGEIDRLVEYFANNPCDYACNHLDRLNSHYADGFGAEILSAKLLEKINEVANELRYREHATLYIWDHVHDFQIKSVSAPTALAYPHLRFDVDMQTDLARLGDFVKAGVTFSTPASEIVDLALAGI
ncbi:MAG: glycosyltransferase family protein [Gammaproteobacteria bacterium]|nr:glycosyltransferase family protein [Gammaproteobacteria bacterium]